MTAPENRRDQLRDNLAVVRGRINAACVAAGRTASDVELVAVTKFFPAADAVLLAELGVTDLGENRDQEAAPKIDEVRQLTDLSVRWHFVGQLQSNKARSVARYADVVHSLDRPSLLTALADAADRAERGPLQVLIQVNLDPSADGDAERGGVRPAELLRFADQVADRDSLHLAGVMAIAPLYGEPEAAFARLNLAAAKLRSMHPSATMVSAGMSGDLEEAIRNGATHVRIGTALLGRRDATFG
ncbi:MAG TPA: YggS family pyridoxal phosphate-dependent enzyme [Jatrophihabitans sp.]|jgi:hypothetical protein